MDKSVWTWFGLVPVKINVNAATCSDVLQSKQFVFPVSTPLVHKANSRIMVFPVWC